MKKRSWLLYWAVVIVSIMISVGPVWADRYDVQFEDVAGAAGISYVGPSWGSMWGDFDGDGSPDLWLINHYYDPSLYLNQGNGTFTDIASQIIPPTFFFGDDHGAAWADFDNDGDQDLYQLADGGDSPVSAFLFVNSGDHFEEMGAALGLDYQIGRGRTPLWLDIDRDGSLDVLHPTLRRADGSDGPTKLFRQTPTGFIDVSEQMGLEPNDVIASNYAQLADLSGDGDLELLMHLSGYPDKVYDMGFEPFEDIQSAIGLVKTGVVLDSAVADFDGDLDNDLFMVRGERSEGLVQVDEYTLEARFRFSGVEQGFSFVTSGDVSVDLYPHWAWSLDEIFIGSAGHHPEENPFTLLPADTTVWGIHDHVPGVDPGLYIGNDVTPRTRHQETGTLGPIFEGVAEIHLELIGSGRFIWIPTNGGGFGDRHGTYDDQVGHPR